jgi:RimJ/RimL family protein N-acetyltransferase
VGLPLETERLIVRAFELEDAEQVHGAWGDTEVGRPLAPGGPSPSLEETQRTLERIIGGYGQSDGGTWAVVVREDDLVIGDCGLFASESGSPGELEIAYRLRRSAWGRGFATEATRAVLRYGFGELGLTRIVADVDSENLASCRVLEKLGMAVEWTDVRGGRTILFYATDHPPPEEQPRPDQGPGSPEEA